MSKILQYLTHWIGTFQSSWNCHTALSQYSNLESVFIYKDFLDSYNLRRVSAMGPGNPPVVRLWTGKTVRFGSRPVQQPDPQLLGGPSPDLYPSTCGFCRIWLDPSVPVSGSSFRVFLFMVACRYPTVLCKILNLLHHCLCSFYWLPV